MCLKKDCQTCTREAKEAEEYAKLLAQTLGRSAADDLES